MSTPNPFSFPVIITSAGLQPQTPASLQSQLIASVTSTNPGYTANLPGSMIEDLSSTAIGAVAQMDQSKVDLVNSLTPNAANVALLLQLAAVYGLTLGTPTNTSVLVVFTGTVGYVIAAGFLVSDSSGNAYAIQGGGVIGSGGTSANLSAIAVAPGSFAVPANTVNVLNTSIPATITLSVNNPSAGTPGSTTGETYQAFRTRVLQAGLAACVGTVRFIKTIIGNLLGAQANLISVQATSGGLRIVVGAVPNTYLVAYAVFISVADVSTLQGSAVSSGRNVTVSLLDYPDTYSVLYVASPSQTVTVAATWNTTLGSTFTGGSAFPGLVQGPLSSYISGLGIGQVINELEMTQIFQAAVASLLPAQYLTRLVFSVYINGTLTAPATGTGAVSGDPESYFVCLPTGVTVTQA